MNITSSEFIISAVSPKQYPQDALPHIVMCGKSNVGKSSLINNLTRKNKLAKVSSSPGKTRLINFFNINKKFMLVDLPGYGYAKASKAEQAKWGKMIETYLTTSDKIALLILLIDIRHAPGANDVQMLYFARECGLPVTVVCTKADKLSKSHWKKRAAKIRTDLGMYYDEDVLYYSTTKECNGKNNLLNSIERYINLYKQRKKNYENTNNNIE